MIRLFVGHDEREAVAFDVFVHSVLTRSSKPVSVCPLSLNTLAGVYNERHTDGSNAFIYSRFLVPYLCDFAGYAIFADGDMLCLDDIAELWDMRDPNKAVQVCQHNYSSKELVKYLGAKNENYPRKNWSSVIIWNCNHPAHRILTPEFVAKQPGSFLHRFSWLLDEEIGHLPLTWNWLANEYPPATFVKLSLVHYTLGTPCFDGYHNRDYSKEWYRELRKILAIPDAEGTDWLTRG